MKSSSINTNLVGSCDHHMVRGSLCVLRVDINTIPQFRLYHKDDGFLATNLVLFSKFQDHFM